MTTIDALVEALAAPGCERIKDFYSVGPVQRAAVESFVEALAQARAEQAEPVAFVHWPFNGGSPKLVWYSNKALEKAIHKAHEGHQSDLLLYPPAAPVAKLEPLDKEHLFAVWEASTHVQGSASFPEFMAHYEVLLDAHNAKLGGAG